MLNAVAFMEVRLFWVFFLPTYIPLILGWVLLNQWENKLNKIWLFQYGQLLTSAELGVRDA